MSGTGIPEDLFFNRRSYEDALYRNAHTDLDIFAMQHRSIHSDPGVLFDHQKFEKSLIKNHLLKQLEDSSRVVYRHVGPRRRIFPVTGIDDLSSGQAILLQSMYKKYSTKPCLFKADFPDHQSGLDRHRNTSKINVLPLEYYFQDRNFSNQGRVVSTSLSSSATSLYSEEDVLSRYSSNPSPAPSVTSECPSFSQLCRADSDHENEQDWEDILKDLTLKKEQQNIENNNNVAIKDTETDLNTALESLKCLENFDNSVNSSSSLSIVLEETENQVSLV